MTEYRRAYVPGATWFFTVNLAERRGNRLLLDQIDALRRSFRYVTERRPFRWMRWWSCRIISIVFGRCLPVIRIFSMRWNLLKGHFSRAIEKSERISQSRAKRRERGVWQRSKIMITIESAKTFSYSVNASVTFEGSERVNVINAYVAEAKPGPDPVINRHYGTNIIHFGMANRRLIETAGIYYTERNQGNTGTFRFQVN